MRNPYICCRSVSLECPSPRPNCRPCQKLFGQENFKETLRSRINAASRAIAFFIVPSVVGLLLLGDVIASLLFQSGHFDAGAARYVWSVLGGSAVGLLASTLGRLYSSAFYSLRDTKTPLRFSIIRVVLTITTGYFAGLWLPSELGIDSSWGTAGLTLSAGISGWVEFLLLKRSLDGRIGATGIPFKLVNEILASVAGQYAVGFGIKDGISGRSSGFKGASLFFSALESCTLRWRHYSAWKRRGSG